MKLPILSPRPPHPARPDAAATRRLGWGRLLEGGRTVPTFAVVAVASLLLGVGLARVVQPAPEASSADAFDEGLITAVVERKTLRNEIVARADAGFADAVEISAPAASDEGVQIVTGSLPEVGARIEALQVPVEISGRPVVVLPGAIPAYRSLSFGLKGDDVLQLKAALASVGIDAGDEASDVYDVATATAVAALYQRIGFEPATGPDASPEALRIAEDAVATASDDVAAAQRAVDAARAAQTPAGRLEQDALLRQAQRAEASALRALDAARAETVAAAAAVRAAQADLDRLSRDPAADIAAARAALDEAKGRHATAQSAEGDAADGLATAREATVVAAATHAAAQGPPDTSEQTAALAAARRQLASAQVALTEARNDSLPILPLGEAAFLSELPRRVDEVTAVVGTPPKGPLLTLSGAELALVASVPDADAALLSVGDAAAFTAPVGGDPVKVVVASIAPAAKTGKDETAENEGGESSGGAPASSRMDVTLVPAELTAEQISALDGVNVRVTIPVGDTVEDALTVPLAAVSVGPGGASRVEVVGKDDSSAFVEVATGLAGQGDVEIVPEGSRLEAGDRVVVGR